VGRLTCAVSTVAAPPFVSHHPAFAEVLGDAPRLERVVEADAHEGPVYVPHEDALYFTTLPGAGSPPPVSIKRIALDGECFPLEEERVTVVHCPCVGANGMAPARDGRRLVVCEQGSMSAPARISLLDPATGSAETVVDEWAGQRLNSPNDVVVRSDGTVWFTDPAYGHLQGFRPEPLVGDFVYRHDPATGRTTVVADDFDKPNGLCFSPDESVLYVNDSGVNQELGSHHPGRPHHVRAFDVHDGRRLRNGRLFAVIAPGQPDGMKVDAAGRLYVSSATGVQVFDRAGEALGEIAVPGAVNFCFGGPGRNVLFITDDTAVWAAVLEAKGA
jgi:gluconolactonase